MMTEYEVIQRNNKFLDEMKRLAEKHSASYSLEGEVFKLSLENGRTITMSNIALYSALMFMRGFDAHSLTNNLELNLMELDPA